MKNKILSIILANKRTRRTAIILNVVGAILGSAIIWVMAILVIFFLSISIRHPQTQCLYATTVVILFIIVGLITERKQYSFNESSFYPSFDVSGGGSFMARREIIKITGPAYVITQVILCTSNCVYKIIENNKKSIKLNENELVEAERLIMYLKSKGFNPRFHEVPSEFKSNSSLLGKLAFADIIWCKSTNNQLLIGLNRKYDNAA